MKAYSAKNVARMLDLPVEQVRSYARSGVLDAVRGERGEYRFSFQDLVLLRTAKELTDRRIGPRRIQLALSRLKSRLPSGRPLAGMRISAAGERIVVHDGQAIWQPETGQTQFNFETQETTTAVAPHAPRVPRTAFDNDESMTADDWYALGVDLEPTAPDHALEAYRRALDTEPNHFDTRVNLGRLLHERGRLHAAETHFRLALGSRPADSTALFNLAVCLEDLGRTHEAMEIYHQTIEADSAYADAFYNLARLCEVMGDSPAALRHLQTYRRLTDG